MGIWMDIEKVETIENGLSPMTASSAAQRLHSNLCERRPVLWRKKILAGTTLKP